MKITNSQQRVFLFLGEMAEWSIFFRGLNLYKPHVQHDSLTLYYVLYF